MPTGRDLERCSDAKMKKNKTPWVELVQISVPCAGILNVIECWLLGIFLFGQGIPQ